MARVPLATPGLLGLSPGEGGFRCTLGRVSQRGQTYLLPAALLMSKTKSVWYSLGHVREKRLSFHLAHFLLFHLKAVIKKVVVLR